jgi:ribosomal protein L16 Arg81 hydroxylase
MILIGHCQTSGTYIGLYRRDHSMLLCASNLYVAGKGMRASAPPHADKQDVVVVQTSGRKNWRVFSPPSDPALKPSVEMFARGKGDALEADPNCKLLIEVTLNPGDSPDHEL